MDRYKNGNALSNTAFLDTESLPERMVFNSFRVLQHPVQEISLIYAHYLPTLLESLRLSRNHPPEQWDDNSVNMRMIEIMLDYMTPQALEDVGAPEQLVEILVRAGSKTNKSGDSRETNSSHIRTRIRSVQNFIRLYSLDLDEYHFQRYFTYIFNGLLMPCFSISEPHTGTSPLAIQDKLRQQTIVCLKAAIAAGGLTAEEKHRSQTILIEHLHHVDERTRELSIPALITLLEYYHVSELALNADVEKECLCALLGRFDDEKKAVRMCLYNNLSPLLSKLSDQGIYTTTNALVSQLELSNRHDDTQALGNIENSTAQILLNDEYDTRPAMKTISEIQR
ncbi:hypothetical protein VKS41_000774 [Umbelopsis sp. WA50703]